MLLEAIKKFGVFIVGLLCIIGGFLSFASIGITTQFLRENITRHYLLVSLGFILISLGITSMYFFIRKYKK